MKTLVVGDIHGCLSTFKALIDKAGPVDQIISCGDLIDRGPDSFGVIQYCIDNNIQVVLGNHEISAIEALTDYLGPKYPYQRMGLYDSTWFANGGKSAFNSFGDNLQFCLDYFKSLPLFIKTDYIINDKPVVISHTCLNRNSDNILELDQPLPFRTLTELVWSRTQSSDFSGHFFNIYGHTPTDYLGVKSAQPLITQFGINLDTGCVYDYPDRGKLTGVLLPSMQIIQQDRL